MILLPLAKIKIGVAIIAKMDETTSKGSPSLTIDPFACTQRRADATKQNCINVTKLANCP
jgi:hypothetical protein